MAHAQFVQDRIKQIEELMDLGTDFQVIAEIIRNDGFMIVRDGKDTTEDWVFNQCLIILAERMQAPKD
jgi:hypothetical protein